MTTGLLRLCTNWSDRDRSYCGAIDGVRLYLVGDRCPDHTPNALAGRPEPDALLTIAKANQERRAA